MSSSVSDSKEKEDLLNSYSIKTSESELKKHVSNKK